MKCLPWLLVLLTPVTSLAQWELQESQTTSDLRGIAYAGKGVVWASGTDGTILRTHDGGKTWNRCGTPPEAGHLDFRGIQALRNDSAIAMSSGKGALSRLYKTTDACQSWKLVFTNPDPEGSFDAITIKAPDKDPIGKPLDPSHAWGYVLGDPVDGVFTLFSTTDGGSTWSRRVAAKRKEAGCQIDNFDAIKGERIFAASNQSMLMFSANFVMFVTGGTVTRLGYNDVFSWDGALCHDSTHFLPLDLTHGTSSAGGFALAVSPNETGVYPNTVVIVGGDSSYPNATGANSVTVSRFGNPLFRTVTKSVTPPRGYRCSIAYDKYTDTWFTVGPNGTDVSTDNGRNWRPLTPAPGEPADDNNWTAISLPFVVGPKGRVGRLIRAKLEY